MTQRSLRTVAPFLAGLALFALLAAANEARGFTLWRNYALSGILLGAPVVAVLWHHDVRVPAYIQATIVAGLLLHYGGGSLGSPDPHRMGLLGAHGVNGAYHVHPWWDNLTHGVGIGAGAMAVAHLLKRYQARRGLRWHPATEAAIAFLAALAAGVGVELYEYLGKSAFQTIDQGGYSNTMADLQFNILGAGLGAALAVAVDRLWIGERRLRTDAPPAPRSRAIPPAMRGFVAFTAAPAAATLALAARFLGEQVSAAEEAARYEPALRLLLASAVLAVAAGPLAYAATRRRAA